MTLPSFSTRSTAAHARQPIITAAPSELRDVRDPVIEVQRVGQEQEVLPVVPLDLGARLSADERELQGRASLM